MFQMSTPIQRDQPDLEGDAFFNSENHAAAEMTDSRAQEDTKRERIRDEDGAIEESVARGAESELLKVGNWGSISVVSLAVVSGCKK